MEPSATIGERILADNSMMAMSTSQKVERGVCVRKEGVVALGEEVDEDRDIAITIDKYRVSSDRAKGSD